MPVDAISSEDATDSFCALSPAAPPSPTRLETPQFQPRAGVSARAARARLSTQHSDLNPVRFAYSSPAVLSRGVNRRCFQYVPSRCCPVMRGASVRLRCEFSLLKRESVASVDNPRACLCGRACICAKGENKHTAGHHVCCVR